jgi:predicted DNA-binding transcriptional regulator AlpA
MSSDSSPASQVTATVSSRHVVLSPWVNETLPAWDELLSAHDVARLTRRPRWVLASLVLLGRFPRKCRYHGRGIGWRRSDVLTWLTKNLQAPGCHAEPVSIGRGRIKRQGSLAVEYARTRAARRARGPCSSHLASRR